MLIVVVVFWKRMGVRIRYQGIRVELGSSGIVTCACPAAIGRHERV